MADPLSSLAAVAGLADITCRIGKELYVFFSAAKHASQDIQNVLNELQQLETIISGIQTSAENHNNPQSTTNDQLSLTGILRALHDCKREFEGLRELVRKFKLNQPSSAVKDLANRVKWILEEKKVTQSCQRLERLKLSLVTLLTSAGWQSSIRIQNQLNIGQEDVSKNQEAAALQHQAFHDDIKHAMMNLQTSSTQAQGSLENLQVSTSTGISRLHDIVQTTQVNTTTIKTQIHEAQRAISSDQDEVRDKILQANNNTSKGLRIISKDINQNRKFQKRAFQSQRSLNVFVRKEMDRLQSMIKQLSSVGITKDDIDNGNAMEDDVSLEIITMPLMLMKSYFLKALAMLAEDPYMEISKVDIDILRLEFYKLLAASHAASASVLNEDQSHVSDETSIPARTSIHISAATLNSSSKLNKSHHKQEEFYPTKRRRTFFGEKTDAGMLTIRMHNESNLEPQTQGKAYGALFMPLQRLCQIGVYLEFKKILRGANTPIVSRSIQTFNVADRSSAAFVASQNNDVGKLQSIFSAREASPWDRDENGTGLITYAAVNGAHEACRLLVQEGAPIHDCCSGGNGSLYAVWMDYFARWSQNYYSHRTHDMYPALFHLDYRIELSDFFIQNGARVEDCHGLLDMAHLLHIPLCCTHNSIPFTTLAEMCGYFLRIGCDIEAHNSNGQTAFLFAALSPYLSNTDWLQVLINNGANTAATDSYGCNALHLAFIALTTSYRDEQLESSKDDLLESKLNILLQGGCNPNSVDHKGSTPADYARRIKRSKIWKAALEKAGISCDDIDNEDVYDDSDNTDDNEGTASHGDSERVDDDNNDSVSEDVDSDGGVMLEDL